MADSLSTVGLIAFGIFIAWTIYLLFIIYVPIVFLHFIKLMKKILFSSKEYILVFGISLAVMIFMLYIPMELSGDLITVFVFLPTVFLYNTKEKSTKNEPYYFFLKRILNKTANIKLGTTHASPKVCNGSFIYILFRN